MYCSILDQVDPSQLPIHLFDGPEYILQDYVQQVMQQKIILGILISQVPIYGLQLMGLAIVEGGRWHHADTK